MNDIVAILTTLLAIYAFIMGVFLISENRTPQATLAWMLAFIFAPGIGVIAYLFFGRDRKAFSNRSSLCGKTFAQMQCHCCHLFCPARMPNSIDWRAIA